MTTQEVYGLEKANEIYRANVTPRSRTIALFESEVDGTRFDGREDWFGSDKPIFQRKPCVVYHAVDSSIQSKLDLLLGDGRFPTITSNPDEDEDDEGDEDGLPEEQSKALDRCILSILKEAKLPILWRGMYEAAQASGTTYGYLGAKKGKLISELLPARWTTAERNADQDLEKVVVQYPYIKTEWIANKWQATCYLYRREITAQADTVFKPAVARADGQQPAWAPAVTVPNPFGFVPVIPYYHDIKAQNVAVEDGYPVHRTLLGELEAIHYALSQKHQGALTALPQIVEIGVQPGYNPTPDGTEQMSVQVTMHGGTPGPNNPVRGEYRSRPSGGTKGSRKKGPNHVWQYESPDTKVEALNTPGDALESIDSHTKDLRAKICETLAWVPLDPDSIKFAATVSGKALEILRERELNRVSRDRECFGDAVILATVQMLLRMAVTLGPQLKTPRLAKCLPFLKQFTDSEGWTAPFLQLKWPSYFMPSPEDDEKIVKMANEAYTGGAITKRSQVEAVARIFKIGNVDAYLEQLEEESDKKREQEQADLENSVAKAQADAHTAQRRPGRGDSAAANAGGNAGSNAAAASKASGNPRPGPAKA